MTRSIRSTLALSALIAVGLYAATADAQFATPSGPAGDLSLGTPVGSPGMLLAPASGVNGPTNQSLVGNPSIAAMPRGGIGSGMQGGVGAPTDGLDSNPYAEAPQAARALHYPYHPPRTSGSSTLN